MNKFLKLGVELELEIEGNPEPSAKHTSSYVIYGSYPKHHNLGHIHKKHGNIIAAIDELVNGEIEVHYDNTINDGFELIGSPLTLSENQQVWEKVLTNKRIQPYIHGDDVKESPGNGYGIHDVGMHIHVSGDMITPMVMGKLMVFINAPKNKEFVEFMAGRKLNKFCKTQTRKLEDGEILYHSKDCSRTTKRGKKIDFTLQGSYDVVSSGGTNVHLGYCCVNGWKLTHLGLERGALWATPALGAGDFELRIFKSTVVVSRFNANLEFAVAVVDFCNTTSVKELGYDDFGEWISRLEKRIKYQNLFKMLRKGGYAQGLIPKHETLSEMIRKGKVNFEELGAVA